MQRLLPLARRMARRYRRSDEPLDDLVQVATLGLIKAIDRFDPGRETAFSSYAVPTMLGELKRYFRDNGWAVHVPRGMQERVMQVDNAVKELSRASSAARPRPPRSPRLLGLSAEQVLEAMEAAGAYDAVSLDSYRFGDEGDGETYAESIGVEDERFELVEYGATIAPTLAGPPRARPDRAAPALRRGPHAGRDRRARRRLPDARLAADPARARAAAHGRRAQRLTGGRGGWRAVSWPMPWVGPTAWESPTRSVAAPSRPIGDLTGDADTRRQGTLEERKADAQGRAARAEERAERKRAEAAHLDRRT